MKKDYNRLFLPAYLIQKARSLTLFSLPVLPSLAKFSDGLLG